jgi:hypothetical protein
MAVSVTNIPRRRESPGRGQLHRTTDLQDGSLDDVGVVVGRHHERRLLGYRDDPSFEVSCRKGMDNPNVVPMAGDLAEALARVEEKC